MAPQDWVEKAIAICPPVALRLFPRKVPGLQTSLPNKKLEEHH